MNNSNICNMKSNKKNTIIFAGTILNINYIARTSTAGKESDMVNKYIGFLIDKYEKFKRKKAAIFIEPQLDTGYPDIVILEFYSIPQQKWVALRNNLNGTDIKILYFIQTQGYSKISELQNTLGFSKEVLKKSISRLHKCGLIYFYQQSASVRPISLKSYCRISKVISIEAKIDKWNEAIRQANNNIWFSTESYVLMNKVSCSESIRESCRDKGIGIILVNGKIKTVLASKQRNFPVSYASLQFNEWLMRYINMEENT